MNITTLLESDNITKAGIIPFIRTEKGVEMLFMVSSDPDFGGPDPMISKGHVDPGESPDQAAIREGEEELGLKQSNFAGSPFLVMDEQITGLQSTYVMRILAVEIKNKEDFGQFHYETERVEWMTAEEFMRHGRRSQRMFITKLQQMVGQ